MRLLSLQPVRRVQWSSRQLCEPRASLAGPGHQSLTPWRWRSDAPDWHPFFYGVQTCGARWYARSYFDISHILTALGIIDRSCHGHALKHNILTIIVVANFKISIYTSLTSVDRSTIITMLLHSNYKKQHLEEKKNNILIQLSYRSLPRPLMFSTKSLGMHIKISYENEVMEGKLSGISIAVWSQLGPMLTSINTLLGTLIGPYECISTID